MELIILDDLIHETTLKASFIKKEYKKYRQFNEENPWVVNQMIDDIRLKETPDNTVPDLSFDTIVSFKDKYFIDSYSKIYRQLIERNPYLANTDKDVVLFYSIEEGLYEDQIKKGYKLGDKDKVGRIVTGSDLVLNSIVINIDEFLLIYYSTNN